MDLKAVVIASGFALIFLCAPFLLLVANRKGQLARWDEHERQRLARPLIERPPPRWLQWVGMALIAGYIAFGVISWQRRHDLRLVAAQLPSILWVIGLTAGWRWRAKRMQRRTTDPRQGSGSG